MDLTIVTDPICAWCYIGLARLKAALAENPGVGVSIEWLPFELNPDMPAAGLDREAYFIKKFGAERRAEVEALVATAAAGDGLEFDWAVVKRVPNTRKAHMLMQAAALSGVAADLHERLLLAHFRYGRDIGDRSTLVELAVASGMASALAHTALNDPIAAHRIAKLEAEVAAAGIHCVPFFIVDRRHAYAGALSTQQWSAILEDARYDASSTLEHSSTHSGPKS
jgi:predicted DsbA family dithiol-disulfide isomerase